MEKTKKIRDNSFLFSSIKGCLVAIAISLLGILFFAFVIKMFGITDGFLKPVNQVIKGISVLIGVFVGMKNSKQKGLIQGLVIGIVYTVLAFVIFSALNGKFNFDKSLLNDILFGGITGAICGIIAINFKKSTKK